MHFPTVHSRARSSRSRISTPRLSHPRILGSIFERALLSAEKKQQASSAEFEERINEFASRPNRCDAALVQCRRNCLPCVALPRDHRPAPNPLIILHAIMPYMYVCKFLLICSLIVEHLFWIYLRTFLFCFQYNTKVQRRQSAGYTTVKVYIAASLRTRHTRVFIYSHMSRERY